ncbi:uncharacterized protein LDX57_000783 [Aspergillus melleus]|uniref:uncharacterized protein n=1 Tax=Aspergillus melleus TaxID=138277 RepID=UPI001E8D7B52|nr:uncharacterized protein LDX57_000783 [Aspergillus melleus]KAH8423027.1 hypothetical protein LDX57_000783 [Aspergillus melleus]
MTRASTPPVLLQLQTADSPSSQAAALRTLKNETIGHDQRKEAWIRWGIVPTLAKILTCRLPGDKTPATSDIDETASDRDHSRPRSEGDEACLQAIIVVGSLVQGI